MKNKTTIADLVKFVRTINPEWEVKIYIRQGETRSLNLKTDIDTDKKNKSIVIDVNYNYQDFA